MLLKCLPVSCKLPLSIHLSSAWVFFWLSHPWGSSALASWWPPPLAALVLSFIHVISSAGAEVVLRWTSLTKSPGSRKWGLQIKQRRFLCLLSQVLPGPSERRLGEGGRQETVEGCWNPFREASAFVCFVIAYLSGCLLGLVKVKIGPLSFLLVSVEAFHSDGNELCAHSFYRDWCEWIVKWSHEKSLDTCCVLCVRWKFFFNQWRDEHTHDMESQLALGDSLAF